MTQRYKETRVICLAGRVQGVGFRPFVYRLAKQFSLLGDVQNCSGVVEIQVQGEVENMDAFQQALIAEAPPLAEPEILTLQLIGKKTFVDFSIKKSSDKGRVDIHLPPDFFTCDDCLQELTDPAQRRYRYPFINCTQCGPRYSIIKSLPYDRHNTTMSEFMLCPSCHREYSDPLDRRFHAQPLACRDCGPALTFVMAEQKIDGNEKSLAGCVSAIRNGQIIAVKGVGGYHLICDATNDQAVIRLRQRKRRPDKPLAVMFPMSGQDGLDLVRHFTDATAMELESIKQPMRPIVLVKNKKGSGLSETIAPGLKQLGVFLPYSPLHHLLLDELGAPLVATSGNVSGEPVLFTNSKAEKRLADIADGFLHHDRPIQRPADDTVIRVIDGVARTIRLGRGLAPVELNLPTVLKQPVLAVGGHMKVTVALAWKNRCVISPHIGDLDSLRGIQVFEQVISDLQQLYGVTVEKILCDAHPGYASHRWAHRQHQPVEAVFHHHAHASAIGGEYPEIKNWLCFAWDGVGLGEDNSLWGGEGFTGFSGNWKRVASFRPFYLPGGDKAGRQPWRSEAALRWENHEQWLPDIESSELAFAAWRQKINAPQSSAVGRLFDAAACMVLGQTHTSYEGQGPMLLEAIADEAVDDSIELPLNEDDQGIVRADWSVLLPMLSNKDLSQARRAAIFHNSLSRCLIDQALAVKEKYSFDAIGLTGGVFQNRLLSERIIAMGKTKDFKIHLPKTIPANDGGLCYGQIIEHLGK